MGILLINIICFKMLKNFELIYDHFLIWKLLMLTLTNNNPFTYMYCYQLLQCPYSVVRDFACTYRGFCLHIHSKSQGLLLAHTLHIPKMYLRLILLNFISQQRRLLARDVTERNSVLTNSNSSVYILHIVSGVIQIRNNKK